MWLINKEKKSNLWLRSEYIGVTEQICNDSKLKLSSARSAESCRTHLGEITSSMPPYAFYFETQHKNSFKSMQVYDYL
jgi:hypothetical protein